MDEHFLAINDQSIAINDLMGSSYGEAYIARGMAKYYEALDYCQDFKKLLAKKVNYVINGIIIVNNKICRNLFFVLLSFILKGQQFDLGCSDYVSMANDYRDDGLFSLSLDAYSNCLEIDSNYLEVYVNRGELYSKMKEFNLALNDYNYAEYLGLKSVGLYEVKSDLNYKLNNYLLAIENLNIAISLASRR